MCGIAGIYKRQATADKAEVMSMINCIAHRGPDAAGVFTDQETGLGHRRLSILDTSSFADQPMHSVDGRYVIVFNGEVYNFREIAAKYKLTLKTTSDTEVILEAFAQFGPQVFSEFNGMFALAIFDKQERKVYLLRDRLGVKPIFYGFHDNDLYFSSEIKSLLSLNCWNKEKTLEPSALRSYLHLGYIPEPLTIYKGILKFPSGCWAVADQKGIAFHSYWQPEDKVKSDVVTDEKEALGTLRELIYSSVQYRMISDVPYGTFLSGGVDSSLVTSVASKFSKEKLNTFTIGFQYAKFNEAEHAKTIANHIGTNHHEIYLAKEDVLPLVERIPDVYDEPFADNSAIPSMLVSDFASRHVKMVLTGDGGDESFMGYNTYIWARRLGHPVKHLLGKAAAPFLGLGNARFKRVAGLLKHSSDTSLYSHIFSQENGFFSEAEIDQLLVNEKGGAAFVEPLLSLKRDLEPGERQALLDMRYYLKDDLLVKMDRASMQYSIEAREPLLDYRIIEFAL